MMRILHVNMDFLPSIGGVQVVVHNLALEQSRAGHEVSVLTNRKSARVMRGKLPYAILPVFHRSSHMFRSPDSWLKNFFFSLHAKWIQRHGPFDVCHLHGAMPEGNFIKALQATGAKVILTMHGDDIEMVPEIGYGARLEARKAEEIEIRVRQADAVVGLTEVLADEIVAMGVPPERTHVLPDGVRLGQFEVAPEAIGDVRQRYGIPEDKLVIASIGRNHPIKGLDTIPEAVERLRTIRDDFVWVIVGPRSETLHSQISHRGIKDFMVLCPSIRMSEAEEKEGQYLFPPLDMVAFLKAVDVVVIPSISETFCLGMVEAMAARTVVVGSDIHGLNHRLRDGETGLSYPVGDTNALAHALDRVLEDKQLREFLADNAREIVKELDWGGVARQHVELYRQLLHEG